MKKRLTPINGIRAFRRIFSITQFSTPLNDIQNTKIFCKALMIAAMAVTLGLSTNIFAISSTTSQAADALSATPVQLEEDVNNLVFTGTVKKIPNGTALVTKNATYLLSGGNFDGIVGKEVNIIGKIVKEGSIEKIQVARAQLAQESHDN